MALVESVDDNKGKCQFCFKDQNISDDQQLPQTLMNLISQAGMSGIQVTGKVPRRSETHAIETTVSYPVANRC
jgi:hypothetical protein